MKQSIILRSVIILSTNHSPMTGTMKITNPAVIMFIASDPETNLKVRLTIPVRAKMNAKIPKITPDILFRKIPIH